VAERERVLVCRDAVDTIAEKFCYHNSKANRRRLVSALFGVHRSQLELLPYYARLTATLSACMEDVGSEVR